MKEKKIDNSDNGQMIWNGEPSERLKDANPNQCYFEKFCKKCNQKVVCTEGSCFETQDGELKIRLKCPICGKVTLHDTR